MAKTISLSAVILGCMLLVVHAEPPVNSYSITGNSNAYDYSNSVSNGAYLGVKDGHRENTDFYPGTNNGHSLISNTNQGNIGGSLASTSYSGFSPSTHNNGFGGFASGTPDNRAASPYSLNGHAGSSFEAYTTNGNSNGDSTFEGYATGLNHAASDLNQYSSGSQKPPSYMGYADNNGGISTPVTGSYEPASSADSSAYRGYSGSTSRDPTVAQYLEGDHANGESSYLLNAAGSEYPYGKQKDGIFGIANENKYMNDVHPATSDTRYMRGNHGSVLVGRDYGTPMYFASPGPNTGFPGMRGPGASLYTTGKLNKYGKYLGDYNLNAGSNYVSKDHEADYMPIGYGKGSKIILHKEKRPSSSYGSHVYSGGPSYLSKFIGSYKSKPNSYMSYIGPSVGYSSMSSPHNGMSNYGDAPVVRGYRSSSGYTPGHGGIYPSFY